MKLDTLLEHHPETQVEILLRSFGYGGGFCSHFEKQLLTFFASSPSIVGSSIVWDEVLAVLLPVSDHKIDFVHQVIAFSYGCQNPQEAIGIAKENIRRTLQDQCVVVDAAAYELIFIEGVKDGRFMGPYLERDHQVIYLAENNPAHDHLHQRGGARNINREEFKEHLFAIEREWAHKIYTFSAGVDKALLIVGASHGTETLTLRKKLLEKGIEMNVVLSPTSHND